MKNLLTKNELIDFEQDIAETFNSGLIKAPIHLYSGNEEQMIDIFKNVNEDDWVFCSWRSHYQCLLKGVPQDILKQDIIDGKSITLCYPEFKIYSSYILFNLSISLLNRCLIFTIYYYSSCLFISNQVFICNDNVFYL